MRMSELIKQLRADRANNVMHMAADLLEANLIEIANLELANDEARKTIDRLCKQIPRDASDPAHSGQGE